MYFSWFKQNNWEDVSKALQDELEEKLIAAGVGQEDTSSGRRKRQTQSTPIHIDILDGYPKFDEEKQEMTVIMLVHLGRCSLDSVFTVLFPLEIFLFIFL